MYHKVSACPRCGAPIYALRQETVSNPESGPPQSFFTCTCRYFGQWTVGVEPQPQFVPNNVPIDTTPTVTWNETVLVNDNGEIVVTKSANTIAFLSGFTVAQGIPTGDEKVGKIN